MLLDSNSGMRRTGMGLSTWPGISNATPMYVMQSARLSNGMGFGLKGLGDVTTDVSSWSLSDIIDGIQKGLVVLNSQQVFDINLQRLQNGLPAIPLQYAAPSVNVGLAGVSTQTLLLGAALLVFLLLRK